MRRALFELHRIPVVLVFPIEAASDQSWAGGPGLVIVCEWRGGSRGAVRDAGLGGETTLRQGRPGASLLDLPFVSDSLIPALAGSPLRI